MYDNTNKVIITALFIVKWKEEPHTNPYFKHTMQQIIPIVASLFD